jgi:nitrogen regulatory protein P-II 2
MITVGLKLITIVAEPVLEEQITFELRKLGARGFTVTASHGEGSRGMRASAVPGDGVRIEAVVSAPVADRVLDHVAQHYFPRYAVIAFVGDVQVVRGEKYV